MSTPKKIELGATSNGRLSSYGKQMRARLLYSRGKAFIGAAVLLKQKRGDAWVVRHLLCQGIEVTLKAMLLWTDYDKFKPLLGKRGKLDHDLIRVLLAAEGAVHKTLYRAGTRKELEALNGLYGRGHLRYGSNLDFLVNPETIPIGRVLRRTFALIKSLESSMTTNQQ